MACRARKLIDRVPVPIELEPRQPLQDRVNRRLGRALSVGILYTQQHLPPTAAGEEPVEKGGASTAYVQEAGRGGSKSRFHAPKACPASASWRMHWDLPHTRGEVRWNGSMNDPERAPAESGSD